MPTPTPIIYTTTSGSQLVGELAEDQRNIRSGHIRVWIEGDPFPVDVPKHQVTMEGANTMATKKTAKLLRQEAKALGITGYSSMTKAELLEAVTTAKEAEDIEADEVEEEEEKPKAKKKASSKKKSSSKSKKAKASSNGEADNPFREGSNLYLITEQLKKGGKRSTLTKRLKGKLSFNPRKQDPDDFDVEAEIDRRLKVVGYILKNQHGWEYEHEGRGTDAKIKVTPPSS